MKLLGIDYGMKCIGVALGDLESQTAVPLQTFFHRSMKEDAEKIVTLLHEYGAEKIILGYPLHMDQTESEMSHRVDHLAGILKTLTPHPVILVDERLTTFEAREALKGQHVSARKNRRRFVNAVAASIIVRDYLEEGP